MCYMILHCLRIQCRHAPKGCGKLLTKDELPAHLEKCPFERCKEQLANGRIDPIIKYFKKQVRGVGESSVMCGERPARVFGEPDAARLSLRRLQNETPQYKIYEHKSLKTSKKRRRVTGWRKPIFLISRT